MTPAPPNREDALQIDVRREDNATVVRLTGSANMEHAARLEQSLHAVTRDKPWRVVVDVAELEFISSDGLGALVAAHERCRQHDGGLSIVAPQPHIRTLLTKTRLNRLFTVYDSITEIQSS